MVLNRVCPSLKKLMMVRGLFAATEASGPPAPGEPPRGPGSVCATAAAAPSIRRMEKTERVRPFKLTSFFGHSNGAQRSARTARAGVTWDEGGHSGGEGRAGGDEGMPSGS